MLYGVLHIRTGQTEEHPLFVIHPRLIPADRAEI
jgi:hypothetical protein